MIQFIKDYIPPWAEFIANLLSIAAVLSGAYLYYTKREKISAVYNVVLGLRHQESFRELNRRLDHLDRLNIETKEQRGEAINLLAEILGQLKSNHHLATPAASVITKLTPIIEQGTKMNESAKRQVCAELREVLRGLNYEAISNLSEGPKK